jgi:hypothetical protein
VTRFRHVDDQKAAGFPVTSACEAASVSTSGYYDWCERVAAGPTVRQLADAELVALMRALFDEADGNYGVPRMYKALRHAGLVVNRKRVARLMRRHGMAGRFRRRKCRTTFPGPDGYQIPDLVGRRFDAGAPDQAWCQDITYVATHEGWLYVASVLDLGSRRLLGYSMADHMRTELVLDALDMAITARGGKEAVAGVIGMVFGPAVAVLAIVDPMLGLVAFLGIATAAASATLIQFWFRAQVKRSLFRRRHVSSRIATFAEAFSSITWSGAGALALVNPLLAIVPGGAALVVLAGAWSISPRRG